MLLTNRSQKVSPCTVTLKTVEAPNICKKIGQAGRSKRPPPRAKPEQKTHILVRWPQPATQIAFAKSHWEHQELIIKGGMALVPHLEHEEITVREEKFSLPFVWRRGVVFLDELCSLNPDPPDRFKFRGCDKERKPLPFSCNPAGIAAHVPEPFFSCPLFPCLEQTALLQVHGRPGKEGSRRALETG